jgi:type VII secretion integral membrane protein EccD
MDGNVMTGLCRVTVVAPTVRVDLALPEDVPLAEIFPDVLRLAEQTQPDARSVGFVLTRLAGEPLTGGMSLTAQGVRHGDVLYLRRLSELPPPVVYDDVVDAVATGAEQASAIFRPGMLRALGVVVGSLWLAACALLLALIRPVHGLPAIAAGALAVLLVAAASARARVYQDDLAAGWLAFAALPHALLAGLGALPPAAGHGLGRAQVITALVALLVVAAVAAVLLPRSDAVCVAACVAAGLGLVAVFVGLLVDASGVRVAAVTVTVAVGLIAFMPSLAIRLARFPAAYLIPEPAAAARASGPTDVGARAVTVRDRGAVLSAARGADGDDETGAGRAAPVDATGVITRVRRGHELLLGLIGGCAVVALAGVGVLAFAASGWAQALAGLIAVAMLSRARLFRRAVEVLALVVAGVCGLALLVAGLASHADARGGLGSVFVAVLLAAALTTGVGVTLPGRRVSPFWGRVVDLGEATLLAAVIPVCLAVLDLYTRVRGFGS